MTKIVSRVTEEQDQLNRLREIVRLATGGAIGPDGEEPEAQNINQAIHHVDIMAASLMTTLDDMDHLISSLENDCHEMAVRLVTHDVLIETIRDAIKGGVEYDEELDHATTDAMEAMIGSGMADSTADGELTFDSAILVSKEDFKPIIREAVSSWLEKKLG